MADTVGLALVARLAARAAESPGAAALITPRAGRRGADAIATRAWLATRARDVARGLSAAGMRPGERVVFAVRPGAEAVALAAAIAEVGGVLVAADLGGGDALFAARMAAVGPRWVVAESVVLAAGRSRLTRGLLDRCGVHLPAFGALRRARTVRVGPPLPGTWGDRSVNALARRGVGAAAPAAPEPDAPAFIVFTSGTTAAPKAVVHSGQSLRATLDLVGDQLALEVGDVLYARDLHLALPALFAGARVVMPRDSRFDAAQALADFARHAVTHVFTVPADCQALLAELAVHGRALPATLRHIVIGAAPVHATFLARFRAVLPPGCRVSSVYGMTEMLPVAVASLEEKLAYAGDGDLLGAPARGVTARIAHDGELILRGPHLCIGYLGEPPIRACATGDLARMDPDGRLVLLGRSKDMIIRGAYNLYPGLYEPVVARIPGVRRAAMVGVWDPRAADERVVLVVEPDERDGGEAPAAFADRVRRALRSGPARIDDTAQPDLVLVGSLPEAGRSRKLDRAALRAAAAAALGLTAHRDAVG